MVGKANLGRMSALGHLQTLRSASSMSALPSKADILHHGFCVRFVPEADMKPAEGTVA
jgi:hypothetical protein